LVDRVSVASTLDARNVRPLLTRINVNMPLPAEAACGFALLLAASQAQAADVESGRRLAQQRFLHAAVTCLVRAAAFGAMLGMGGHGRFRRKLPRQRTCFFVSF
jgi:hypothetical protein